MQHAIFRKRYWILVSLSALFMVPFFLWYGRTLPASLLCSFLPFAVLPTILLSPFFVEYCSQRARNRARWSLILELFLATFLFSAFWFSGVRYAGFWPGFLWWGWFLWLLLEALFVRGGGRFYAGFLGIGLWALVSLSYFIFAWEQDLYVRYQVEKIATPPEDMVRPRILWENDSSRNYTVFDDRLELAEFHLPEGFHFHPPLAEPVAFPVALPAIELFRLSGNGMDPDRLPIVSAFRLYGNFPAETMEWINSVQVGLGQLVRAGKITELSFRGLAEFSEGNHPFSGPSWDLTVPGTKRRLTLYGDPDRIIYLLVLEEVPQGFPHQPLVLELLRNIKLQDIKKVKQ